MDEDEIRKIAEAAFKALFRDVRIVRNNVRPRLDHDGDRVVDANIICDDVIYEKLNGAGLSRVHSDVVSKAWREVEDDLGFLFAKSDLGRRDLATV